MREPIKEYKGILILPADRNSSGIRWTARLANGDLLRADTLQGIKELIKEKTLKNAKGEN
jgi:hypothetical protein